MQEFSGYPTYVVNAGISAQDGSGNYYMDPRIHGNQQAVTWREVQPGREDTSGTLTYPGTHYVPAGWDAKAYGSDIPHEEEYFHASEPIDPEPRKRKRRRVISVEQRRAANVRERKRMFQLNEAFCVLRKRVPTFAYEKKLSRIETLKLAVTYIKFMTELLEQEDEKGTPSQEDKTSTLDKESMSSQGHEESDSAPQAEDPSGATDN